MSALTNEPGQVIIQYDSSVLKDNAVQQFSASGVLAASDTKLAFIGSIYHPTVKTGTINIRKVHWRCGAVTFLATSDITVSLQNVSATGGPPYQPDGTQDQTAQMTALNANAWNTTGNLSADRAVNLANDSLGDADSRWVAVVFEYATFVVTDSVVISVMSNATTNPRGLGNNLLLKAGAGAWAATANRASNVMFECDDGTFAFFEGCTAWVNLASASVASNGAIRRAGVIFQVPTQRKIDRFAMMIAIANGGDGTLTLYDSDGTTVLVSVDIDNDAVIEQGSPFLMEATFAPITLAANTNYYFVFVATTTTATTVYYGEVNAAGHMAGYFLGASATWAQHNGTDWDVTLTSRRPHFGLGFSAFHDGDGGAGGALMVIPQTNVMMGA